MKKLWTFGCSFTYGDGTLQHDKYRIKYKVSDDDLPWPKLMAQKFNLQLKNLGLSGSSNETIIDRLISNYNYIGEGDLVIIGKTWSHRFDFPKTMGSLVPQSIVYRGGEEDVKKWFDDLTVTIYTDNQIDCIKSFSAEFAIQPLYSHRHDIRFNFLKDRLLVDKKVKICQIWDVENQWKNFDTIVNATNGSIIDHHWSYKGHKDFLTFLEKQILKNKKII